MLRNIFLCFGLFVLNTCQWIYAFPADGFHIYLVSNGLSNSTVWCGMQDKWGFLWFGTGNGLDRFDGYEFRTFKDDSLCARGNMDIRTICEETESVWWIGYEKGVALFDVHKGSFTPMFSYQIKIQVQKIIKDTANQLVWIATRGKGIYRYDCRSKKISHLNGNLTIVWDLAYDEQGNIYAATHQNGLVCYTKEGHIFDSYSNGQQKNNYIADNEVKSLFYEDGILWVGTWQGGFYRIDLKKGNTTSFFSPDNSSYIPHLRVVVPYYKEELLLGTDEGVYVFDRTTGKVRSLDASLQPGLSDRAVHSIHVDHSGGIWIGTVIGGVNYLPFLRKKIETYTPFFTGKINFSGKIVTSFQEDQQGNLWIATEDGGLNYFDPRQKTSKIYLPRKEKNSLSYHNLRSLLLDGDYLWIGTFSKGVDRLNLKTGMFTNYHNIKEDTTSLSDNSVYAMLKHSNGDIYLGTVWGLNKYNPVTDNFTRIPEINSDAQIHDIMEDGDANIWLGTYNRGVYCYQYKQKKWVQYFPGSEQDRLSFNRTICLFSDHAKRLWVGTYGAGLSFFDPSRQLFLSYQGTEELKTATIYSIEEDPSGNLWLGSDIGLFRLDPNKPESLQLFTKEDGLQENKFYFNSVLKAKDGKFYFGGINGFSSFNPEEIETNPHKPVVQITSFLLYNTEMFAGENIVFMDTLKLSYKQNMLGFSFSALNYEIPEKNRYAYWLKGVDEGWVYTGNHSVSYANLQPGRYLLRVKAANNDGLWGEQEKQLMIIISPPFWKSTIAYLLYVFLFFVIVFFILKGTYRWIHRKNLLKMEYIQQENEHQIYKQKLDFFTQIAHDIRTPLSLIKGPLEEILKTDRSKEYTDKMLKIIQKNTNYLIRLVDQLLLFRKIESKGMDLMFEKCDVNSLLSDIYDRFQAYPEQKHIVFTLKMPDTPTYVWIDRFAFDKIVSNILFNAFKFAKDCVKIQLLILEGKMILRVSDNGSGIPSSMYKQIFAPFYSGDSEHGTGIGLSLVKQLVDQLQGTIHVEETEGGGATFVLQIPLYLKEYENDPQIVLTDIPETLSENETDQSDKYMILVVEDNQELRKFIVSLLEEQYRVCQAENGGAAIEVLKSEIIHLIISDVMMPGMDGFELCAYVKHEKSLCYIPFIMLTAKVSEEAHIQVLEQGADAYISKPFSGKVLLTQIENLLQNRLMLYQNYLSTPYANIDLTSLNGQDKLFIEELNKRIEKNLADRDVEFSINSLASELGMSRSVLYRRIKGTFNLSPNDYLRNYKLKYAAYLLKERGLRASEVADSLGFSSSSYFSRCFKEQFGVTPKDFIQDHFDDLGN